MVGQAEQLGRPVQKSCQAEEERGEAQHKSALEANILDQEHRWDVCGGDNSEHEADLECAHIEIE